MMANLVSLICWFEGGPAFPRAHLFIPKEKRPKELGKLVRVYFRKWFIHPIKRRVAKYYLILLKNFFGLKVIAITGSAGKTTTKEMIASVLSQQYETVWSSANIDPVYNIPTTILKCWPNTQRLILEMGIEFPGEMEFYLWLAQPDVGIVTTLYLTHTEFLGSLKNVTGEKAKLIESLPKGGWAILNADDPRVARIRNRTKAKTLFYGTKGGAVISAAQIEFTHDLKTTFRLTVGKKSIEVTIPALGKLYVSNALAAAAVGFVNGVSLELIKKGLETFKPQPHRMIPVKSRSGAWIIDDTYNSNPLAAKEALATLAKISAKRRIAILGEMKELGTYEERGHREVGDFAGRIGINEVIGEGGPTQILLDAAKRHGVKIYSANNHKAVINRLKNKIDHGSVVLIKGSRALKMEKIVSSLLK